ncbi:hypothetical protein MSAN_02431000 [Mycena sanguinolenta]|uniref:Uncharacterized protein n=1 Tax=Mycena sanguinolenta TaxID=230812 RepID=A0A8H7CE70_9AGAR|nr:hypothetical protein MSAN_02431000 [Mycena sanguinolenta]
MPHRLSALHTLTRPRLHQQASSAARRTKGVPRHRPLPPPIATLPTHSGSPSPSAASTLNDRGAVSTPSGRTTHAPPAHHAPYPPPGAYEIRCGRVYVRPGDPARAPPVVRAAALPHHSWRLCPVSVARHDPQPADAPVRRDWWRRWWRHDPDGAHGRRGDEAQRSRAEKMLQLLHHRDEYVAEEQFQPEKSPNAASSNVPIRAPRPEQFPHKRGPLASFTLRSRSP